MSPAPQPPRPGPGGKPGPAPAGKPGPAPAGKGPAPAGKPGPAPAPKAAPGKPAAPPPKAKQPEHPAEVDDPNAPARAGKYFEIRKGSSGSLHKEKEEDDAPIMDVALPRSITQEQEQADLKARLGREELVDIDKRNSLVKVKDTAAGPSRLGRKSSGLWLLVLVALLAVAAIIADKVHLLDKLKGH